MTNLFSFTTDISPEQAGAVMLAMPPGAAPCAAAKKSQNRSCGPEVAPLAYGRLPSVTLPMRYALEPHHLEPHQLAHAANLASSAFGQDKAQLLGVLPLHLGRLERLTVQAQAMAQAFQQTLPARSPARWC